MGTIYDTDISQSLLFHLFRLRGKGVKALQEVQLQCDSFDPQHGWSWLGMAHIFLHPIMWCILMLHPPLKEQSPVGDHAWEDTNV